MRQFMASKGIIAEFSAPYSPKQNGKAERHNRVLMERTRAMLLGSRLPLANWGEALVAASFIMNRSPTADGSATPHERFYAKRPDVSMLRVWGCKTYAKRPPKSAGKLESRVIVGHMVGYNSGWHAWRSRSAATGAILTRRDVEFDETGPPSPVIADALHVCPHLPDDWFDDDRSSDDGGDEVTAQAGQTPGVPTVHNLTDALTLLPAATPPPAPTPTNVPPTAPAPTLEYNLRPRTGSGGPSALSASTRGTPTGVEPDPPLEDAPISVEAAIRQTDWCPEPPRTRAEALSRGDAYLWKEALDVEYMALLENNTWTVVDLPCGAQRMRGKWVFNYKRDADTNITRYKARYVGCGYSQRAGVDYHEVWAPCPARETVRTVLAYAAAHDLELDTIDIKTAYLNAPMDVDVYVDLPAGYSNGGPNTVAKLRSALYGTKQAGRLWGEHLSATLTRVGATRSTTDPTLYTWDHPVHGRILILAHVDDLATLGKTRAAVDAAKGVLFQRYKGRDMGAAKDFLGMRIVRDRPHRMLTISCPGLIKELLSNFGMTDAHPAQLPMPAGTALRRTGDLPMDTSGRYQELVGSLLYLAASVRPDIAFAANTPARFMNQPEESHWRAAKGVVRYLAGTVDLGLQYGGSGELEGAVDADYNGCPDTRRSTTGWVFMNGGGAISWSSKLQPTVSCSTAEAEYITAAAATREALWLKKLMGDLGEPDRPVPMAEDNLACLSLIANPEGTGRAKHIDTAHHLVRERAAMGAVKFFHRPGAEMVADGLTKALAGPSMAEFRRRLGIVQPGKTATTAATV